MEFDCIEWGWVWVGLDWIGVLFRTLDGSGTSKWFAEKAPGVLFSVLRDSKNRILENEKCDFDSFMNARSTFFNVPGSLEGFPRLFRAVQGSLGIFRSDEHSRIYEKCDFDGFMKARTTFFRVPGSLEGSPRLSTALQGSFGMGLGAGRGVREPPHTPKSGDFKAEFSSESTDQPVAPTQPTRRVGEFWDAG